jgi:hypothetical protein
MGVFSRAKKSSRRPATRDKRPFEGVDEIVLFQYFIERGLALLTSYFFCGLLFYYGI